MKRDTGVPYFHSGLWIGRYGGRQGFEKAGLKCLIALKPAPNCACTAGQEIGVGLPS